MTLVYYLQFQDIEARSEFSGHFHAHYGDAGGAADFTHRILTSGIDMSVEVQGIVSGVKSAPDIFFEVPGVDQQTAKVPSQPAGRSAFAVLF